MTFIPLLALTHEDYGYFFAVLMLVCIVLIASFFFGWWMRRRELAPSPYTGIRLRRASDMHWLTMEKVLRYLYDMHDYNNRLFDLNRAVICRETGRIFPEAITWYGAIQVDWSFLQRRYPGKFVSWGSLSEEQQLLIRDQHNTLEGFQTEYSSTKPSPRAVEPEYIYKKPGPLYVDVDSAMLLGWKCIPETELEVLILQRPKEKYIPGVHKKY